MPITLELRLLFPCIACPLYQPRPSAVVVVQRIWYCACPAPKAHLSARRPSGGLILGNLLRKPALPLCASALLALRVALFPPERLGITSPCKTVPSQDLAREPLIPHQTGFLALRLRCHWQKALLSATRRRGVRDFLRGHPLRRGVFGIFFVGMISGCTSFCGFLFFLFASLSRVSSSEGSRLPFTSSSTSRECTMLPPTSSF